MSGSNVVLSLVLNFYHKSAAWYDRRKRQGIERTESMNLELRIVYLSNYAS